MPVRMLSEEDRVTQSRALQALHDEWAAEQIAAGVDGPVPPGRKDPSDYNQHVPDMEASAAPLDAFWDRAAEIIG